LFISATSSTYCRQQIYPQTDVTDSIVLWTASVFSQTKGENLTVTDVLTNVDSKL